MTWACVSSNVELSGENKLGREGALSLFSVSGSYDATDLDEDMKLKGGLARSYFLILCLFFSV